MPGFIDRVNDLRAGACMREVDTARSQDLTNLRCCPELRRKNKPGAFREATKWTPIAQAVTPETLFRAKSDRALAGSGFDFGFMEEVH